MSHATLTQVRTGKNGRLVEVDSDVFDLAKRLHEIDTSLGLDWNEVGQYFRVYQDLLDGSRVMVTTSNELSPALLEEVRRIVQPGFDAGAEADRMDAAARREKEHQRKEKQGEVSERLKHAIKKDMGFNPSIIVPASVKSIQG
jgi:hypothetical protein